VTDPLIIDVYPGDHRVDWAAFCAEGEPWVGAILKASQGIRYSYLEWLTHNRNQLRDAAGDRYGVTMFDGMYHYLDLSVSGIRQADYFWSVCEQAGGERAGTLPAMVDVERGGQTIKAMTQTQVEDCTRAFADRIHVLSGREPTLYGGELLRAVGVKDRLGCGRSAVALYASRLGTKGESTEAFLARTGTDLAHTMLWQYCGTDAAEDGPIGYPLRAPGCVDPVDINAVILPGGLEALRALLPAKE